MQMVCPTTTLIHSLSRAYWTMLFTVFQVETGSPFAPLTLAPELESPDLEGSTEVDEPDTPVAPTNGRSRTCPSFLSLRNCTQF